MNVRRATAEEVAAVVALARESFNAAVAPLYGEEGNAVAEERVDRGIRFIMMALNRKKPLQATAATRRS